jgi:hypothetical protein
MLTWIVQSNLIKEDILESIQDATKKLGYSCVPLKIIPFSDSLEFGPDFGFQPPPGKLIPYGSTSMIKMFAKSNWNKDGFFFNEENLRTSKWIKELGTRMLNHDAQVVTLSEAFKIKEGWFFMKPDNDLKDFSGSQVSAEGIEKFYNQVSAGGFTFGTDIKVVLCPLKNTGWEFRLFMVEDQVISSSSYKLKEMLRQDKRVSHEVLQFAQETVRTWRPDSVYVMDICETNEGLKVVEFNCFNASGFYSCDVEAVVKAVSEKVLS